MVKIEKQDGKLYVHEEEVKREGKTLTSFDFLLPFPSNLCSSAEDRHVVAVHLARSDAVSWMHDAVKYMLAGE